jgi:hypothetical protein
MKQTIHLSDFRDAFHNAGRGRQFSYQALELLYDFFEEIDPDYDLDVVAICCDFEESGSALIRKAYDLESDTDVEEYLRHHTSLVGKTADGLFVYQSF